MINFFNTDCMLFMKDKPDNYYDLAIVDPPYGIGEDGIKNHSRDRLAKATRDTPKEWDNKSPNFAYFEQLKRISRNQIIWGANHFIENIPNANSSCWIVWDKDNSGDFADCELAYASFKTAVRKFKWTWNGMLQQNMKNKQKRIHPTEKPIELYRWLMQNYAKDGHRILDTHGGSMSIAIAADTEGFDLDVTEIDKEYFEKGVERYNWHKRQLKLF